MLTTKFWCKKDEQHKGMCKFVGEVVEQFSATKLGYDLRHIHTCLSWGFRDRQLYGYRLKVDREGNQVNIYKETERLAAVKIHDYAN